MRRRGKASGPSEKSVLPKARKEPIAGLSTAHVQEKLDRALRERDEALEQVSATSAMLKIISKSPGELEPVFDAMLANATRICDAKFATLYLRDGDALRAVAFARDAPPGYVEARKRNLWQPSRDGPLEQVVATKQVVHVADLKELRPYRERRPFIVAAVELGGFRTLLMVPMLRDDELVGAISILRQEVRPFSDKQINLLENFAAQAVIAIENTRLLNELRHRTDDLSEALEQQTATSEVLKVISSSPGELEPVFNAMLKNAVRICDAKFGHLWQREGDALRVGATHGAPEVFAAYLREQPLLHPKPQTGLGQLLRTKQLFQLEDITAVPTYGDKLREATINLAGARSLIGVPMVRDEEVIGAIVIYRQEVRPFTDKQIELVQNFAAQVVIAIENARLLTELRESLEQQTATSEVLQIISASPGQLEPVFMAMLGNAVRTCGAKFGIMYLSEGDGFRTVAMHDVPRPFAEKRQREPFFRPSAGSPMDRIVRTGQVAHISDITTVQGYVEGDRPLMDLAELGGARTVAGVPMLKENELIGAIIIYRQEVRPFTEKQIDLVKNFAAQAVIAIENTRLLSELRQRTDDLSESLEHLRTTQDRLVQTQKLASLGQLTAGIAHEMKNPLNFVNNFSAVSSELIDELQDTLKDLPVADKARAEINDLTDTLRDNLDKVVQHGKRADAIVKNMLLHSRESSGEHRPVDINALVEESLNLAWHGTRAEKQGFEIKLKQSFDPSAGEADVFPQDITRALLNLISNGFYAATKRRAATNSTNYEPTLAASTKSLGDRVEIRIRDNGTGMPPNVKEKMFDPFFTTKPTGEGTGLGLSISHDIIVKQHAGSIEVDTQLGEFTEIRVILPRAAVVP
jgi:GAF domain-containing protein